MKMTTPDLLINSLANLGIDHIFHLPGSAMTGCYATLCRHKKITSVLFKHEQGACFAAAGYALVTNRVGVCLVMGGPGVTNLISSVAECYHQSIPIVVITVDNPRKDLGIEAFHEVDSFAMLEPVTKKIIIPEKAADVQRAVHEAVRSASEGRPGPVYLNIPMSITGHSARMRDIPANIKPANRPSVSAVRKALNLIGGGREPVIFAGSGVMRSGAETELAEFVKLSGIPVFTSLGGRGSIPENARLVMGMPPYDFNIQFLNEADLFIVLGARLNPVNLRMGQLTIPHKMLRIDIDDENPNIKKADLYIRADVREFLKQANNEARNGRLPGKPGISRLYSTYRKAFTDFKSDNDRKVVANSSKLTSKRFLLEMSRLLEKKTATLFTDSIWTPFSHLLPCVKKPRSFFSIGSYGCLGFALPAAIGAAFAQPRKKVISLSGDGAFLFNCQGLSTAATYRLKNFVQIILNNSGYSLLHSAARTQHAIQDRDYTWDEINYESFAESFGVKTITVDSLSKIEPALQKALSGNGPYVLNVITTDDGI